MLTTLREYLPTIGAVIVAVITIYGNYRVSKLKTNLDSRVMLNSASDALRDDLLIFIDKYDKREQELIKEVKELKDQNAKQEAHNIELRDNQNQLNIQIAQLRIENNVLTTELKLTRERLAEFDRKVYYIQKKQDIQENQQ